MLWENPDVSQTDWNTSESGREPCFIKNAGQGFSCVVEKRNTFRFRNLNFWKQ